MDRHNSKKTAAKYGVWHTTINLFLILLIVTLYVVISTPKSINAMSTAIRYKAGSSSSVSIQFALSWKAAALDGILSQLKNNKVNATFFVTAEFAESFPQEVRKITQYGNELGILVLFDTDMNSYFRRTLSAINTATGNTNITLCLIGDDSVNLTKTVKAAKPLDIECIKCTIDLLCQRGTEFDCIARARNASAGSIISMTPTKNAEKALGAIISELNKRGFSIVPTGVLLATQ